MSGKRMLIYPVKERGALSPNPPKHTVSNFSLPCPEGPHQTDLWMEGLVLLLGFVQLTVKDREKKQSSKLPPVSSG